MIIGRRIEDLDYDTILKVIEHQAKQGVDYFTVHAGVLREHLSLVKNRLIGIVARGGSTELMGYGVRWAAQATGSGSQARIATTSLAGSAGSGTAASCTWKTRPSSTSLTSTWAR